MQLKIRDYIFIVIYCKLRSVENQINLFAKYQYKFNLVTIITLMVWSSPLNTLKPNLSLFQSKLLIHCWQTSLWFNIYILPITPLSFPYGSFNERCEGYIYLYKLSAPFPPRVTNRSLFCGVCFIPQMVAFWPVYVCEAYPLVLLKVLKSNNVNLLYNVAAPNLFINISFLSNSTPHTPFFKFVYQSNIFVFKSNNFTSPLSYPEAMTLSSVVWAFPNATDQQSGLTSAYTGSSVMVGVFWRGSQTATAPSLPPVTISHGPTPCPSEPAPSTEFTILWWAWTCQNTFYFYKSRMFSFPSRSPNAKQTWDVGLAANVPDLIPLGCSIVDNTFN